VSRTLSERARSGFDRFIMAATRSAFALPSSECSVTPIEEPAASGAHEVVMLTVSSYRFRVLLFIHFQRNDATRMHLAALANDLSGGLDGSGVAGAMRDERFADAMMERGNLCCGALNRELSRFFPHLGMSTPCILHGSALEHLGALRPSTTRHYRAELAPGVVMHLTLAICAFADIDFAFGEEMMESNASGELEMF
jgi:hypothetical protein